MRKGKACPDVTFGDVRALHKSAEKLARINSVNSLQAGMPGKDAIVAWRQQAREKNEAQEAGHKGSTLTQTGPQNAGKRDALEISGVGHFSLPSACILFHPETH